ncbi:MAG: dTDP-4-dehydrorhamnose 3,5-epimerase [Steroidobacteraceae bacterium]|nr:dTDP-4-dehydrorhamnose 3,5-epimerase [Steroidobacteraceae bacterium]
MKFTACCVEDARLIEPTPHQDFRGRFMRAWCAHEFAQNEIDFTPLQANMGFSRLRGTIRGMHYQTYPALEAKLVRCTRGSMFDVVLDLRRGSPSFRAWYGAVLSADNGHMLFIPEGCAHGCQSLEDDTEFHYMTSAAFSPAHATGVRHDDPAFGIHWPMPATAISDQDRGWALMGS